MKATLGIQKGKEISKIDNRIYGSFVEHLGRAVYGGIYEPGHETADDMGFRKDVLEEIKKINVPIVRYPGGNFVSGYNWEDGTGDRNKRPRRLELAWSSIETNEIGIDEFQEWAKRAGTEVMMAVNLGTRGAEEARNLVEYCNSSTDTYYANKRRENGFDKPFAIKTWCLGNEMDGPWQMGAKKPMEYARLACETGKMMKWVDDSIELVACGSSSPDMPTFGEWERTVLREAYDQIDYMSMHNYYRNDAGDTATFLGSSMVMDKFIKDVAAMCDEIKAEKKSEKTINLSFDEWNVWFHSDESDKKLEKWMVAPPRLEDIYDLQDGLVVGSLLITLLKNADRVKIACLAQLVNVIAPIMTVNGGKVWLQTIFYPYYYTSVNGRGTALKTECKCDSYDAGKLKNIPYIDAVAVQTDDNGLNVFVINRNLKEACELDINKEGFEDYRAVEMITLSGDDMTAHNSADNPNNVVPQKKSISEDGKIVLEKASWSMIRFEK